MSLSLLLSPSLTLSASLHCATTPPSSRQLEIGELASRQGEKFELQGSFIRETRAESETCLLLFKYFLAGTLFLIILQDVC